MFSKSEFILAADANFFFNMVQPFHKVDFTTEDFENKILPFLSLRMREVEPLQIFANDKGLENDLRFRQVLPYIILSYFDEDKQEEVFFTYQRTKGIGEQKLLGNYSIGLGGHIDFSDCVNVANALDFRKTLSYSSIRELDEELEAPFFFDRENLKPIGIILDFNPVGLVHAGFVSSISLSGKTKEEISRIATKEPALLTIGWLTKKELLSLNIEGWTKIYLENVVA